MAFWKALGANLAPKWRQVGGQVGAKLAPKSIKMESKMTSKKEVETKRVATFFGGIDGGPGTPWEGDLGGGKNGSMDQSYSISTRQWAKGPANF